MLRRLLGKVTRWGMRDLNRAVDTVAFVRRLAARSTRYEFDLALGLTLLGETQARAERRQDALASLEEAEQISRRRAAVEPARYEPVLARALLQQAIIRHGDEALDPAEQAVTLYQKLLPRDPNRFEPFFAHALNVFGASLMESGRPGDALPIVEHAVRLGRRLAHDTEAHEPTLAKALHLLGACLIDMERYEDGLRATEEAIAIRRRLAARDPEAHDPSLASLRRIHNGALDGLTRLVAERAEPGEVVLGPYPLCYQCKNVNGGLVAVRHRQVHVHAHGKESCVDEALAVIITKLWAVCDTLTCCEDDGGRAYVTPAAGHVAAAEQLLTSLGIHVENEQGTLYFRLPSGEAT